MRDISKKILTHREAVARSVLHVSPETIAMLHADTLPKGNPLDVTKVAAIQAAKNTAQIVPYCHPVPVDFVGVEFDIQTNAIVTTVTVKANYKTGMEMEALTAASVASLTLYDMMKMVDEAMTIGETVLLSKTGGKSDFSHAWAQQLTAAVLVMSDSVAAGKKSDQSGRLIEERLNDLGLQVKEYRVVSDDPEAIREAILKYADNDSLDLVVTTGGTGVSPRDNTPEIMADLLEREIPGIAEAARVYGQERTPYAMLSRSMAGVRGKTLIINLPGSTGGVTESLDALFPGVLHAFKMMWGYGHEKHEKNTQEKIHADIR